jgi:glycosyltransferase involved in cell wall biosynthesis
MRLSHDYTPVSAPGDFELERERRKHFRLAVVTSHPVQYQAPFFRSLSAHGDIALSVFYGNDGSIAGDFDPGFGQVIKWDTPLLAGYSHRFLTSRSAQLGPLGVLRHYCALSGYFQREKFDAVMIHSYATPLSVVAYLAAAVTRTPVLLRTESECLPSRSVMRTLLRRVVVTPLLWMTAGCLVIGEQNRRFYRSCGVPPRKLFASPYAVDNAAFAQQRSELLPRRRALRRELGFEGDLPVIVFSAKLIPRKRPLDLLSAYSRLIKEGRKAGLLVIGDGELRGELQGAIDRERLDRVVVAGFQNQSELARFYIAGDIFVLPAGFDTWGLVVNEAMLFEMPAVVTHMVGAGYDLVTPGETGLVYPAGDVDALTNCLRSLIDQPDVRRRMGQAARRRVETYAYEADIDGMLAALRQVCRRLATS